MSPTSRSKPSRRSSCRRRPGCHQTDSPGSSAGLMAADSQDERRWRRDGAGAIVLFPRPLCPPRTNQRLAMTKTLHHRACHLCEAICGLNIETTEAEGRVQITSIKGDPQDTFSRGHICPKAVALQDIQNDPDRLHQPMRRVGTEWLPIEWDEAFA